MEFPNPDGKIIAIIGSRTFKDRKAIRDYLLPRRNKIKLIISGAAQGADSEGVIVAHELGIPTLEFPALWHDPETGVLDRGAGYKRNHWIIKNAEYIICWWDGHSKGTLNSINIAKSLNKPVKIFYFTP